MLRLRDVTLRAGNFRLHPVSLDVAAGEYFVLMGPTGSGKSLLVQAVCGLVRIESGGIAIGGKDVTVAESRFRRVGYVPQTAALFPHLSVARNVSFGLEVRGTGRRQAPRKVAPIVEMLGLAHLMGRSTVNLSGGETQKVALARALACDPKLLILDEPVSALDEPTRREICPLLRQVQQQFGVATVHVCHSREEAAAVADRVGVMSAGRLAQTGSLAELAADPADEAVRRLLPTD
jgi:molybdate/tungstate transport system ATP-binding protein